MQVHSSHATHPHFGIHSYLSPEDLKNSSAWIRLIDNNGAGCGTNVTSRRPSCETLPVAHLDAAPEPHGDSITDVRPEVWRLASTVRAHGVLARLHFCAEDNRVGVLDVVRVGLGVAA